MTFDYYNVINRAEFLATGLVSRTVELILEGIGRKEILVTSGNYVSLTVDDVMLSVGMGGNNPFIFGGMAVLLDTNDDIWLGIPRDED